MTEKLLKRLSKKYHDRVKSLEPESDLVDDCKFMLYLNDRWIFSDGGQSIPVKSVTEAIEWVQKAYKE